MLDVGEAKWIPQRSSLLNALEKGASVILIIATFRIFSACLFVDVI